MRFLDNVNVSVLFNGKLQLGKQYLNQFLGNLLKIIITV